LKREIRDEPLESGERERDTVVDGQKGFPRSRERRMGGGEGKKEGTRTHRVEKSSVPKFFAKPHQQGGDRNEETSGINCHRERLYSKKLLLKETEGLRGEKTTRLGSLEGKKISDSLSPGGELSLDQKGERGKSEFPTSRVRLLLRKDSDPCNNLPNRERGNVYPKGHAGLKRKGKKRFIKSGRRVGGVGAEGDFPKRGKSPIFGGGTKENTGARRARREPLFLVLRRGEKKERSPPEREGTATFNGERKFCGRKVLTT